MSFHELLAWKRALLALRAQAPADERWMYDDELRRPHADDDAYQHLRVAYGAARRARPPRQRRDRRRLNGRRPRARRVASRAAGGGEPDLPGLTA